MARPLIARIKTTMGWGLGILASVLLYSRGVPRSQRAARPTHFKTSASVASMLVMVTPGGFQRFLEELSSLNQGLPAPDMVRSERLAQEYGIEVLGPPLS